jgi:aryl-alcohol dehydrogenase-like predicted oxidoreductase
MKIPRRTFLGGSILGIGGLLLGGRGLAAETEMPRSVGFDPYQIVELGKTGLKVSRVGLGTGMKGGNQESNQTRLGKEKFSELIRGCFDRGINWFDMADLYGSHSYLRPALGEVKRDKIVIVSKLWLGSRGVSIPQEERLDVEKTVGRFLKEIGTDYIDMVLLHCMMDKDWPTRYEKQMTVLAELKKKGVMRAHGVSCHSLDALQTAAAEPWVDSVHARINPYGASMDGEPEVVVPVLEQIHAAGKGVVGMKLMGEGRFRDSDLKRNYSVEFVLNLGTVDTMVVGFENLGEVDDFAGRVKAAVRRDTVQNKA